MKKVIMGGLVGGLAALFLIAAYPSSPEPIIVTVPEQKEDVSDSVSSMKHYFMDECNVEGNQYNYCSCVFEYLDNTLTNADFIKIDQEFAKNTEVMPQVLEDAMISCAGYLN